MIAAVLLAAAQPAVAAPPPQTAIEAERAFAADAQKLGQWTAFRKYATEDAVMFVPEQINAQAWLKEKKDPAVAVFWWPGRSYVSCDGTIAVNTGPWVREWGKSVGYFTTVWKRQPDGSWKWIYDAGDSLPTARAEGGDIRPVGASCTNPPKTSPLGLITAAGAKADAGKSSDRTLIWAWAVDPNGARQFKAQLWNGRAFETVVEDKVGAQP